MIRRIVILLVSILVVSGCAKKHQPAIPTVAADAFEKPAAPRDRESEKSDPEDGSQEGVSGRLTLPESGVWPWPVGPAPTSPSNPVALHPQMPSEYSVHNAAVNPTADRGVVFLWKMDFKTKLRGTRVLLCDLARGEIAMQWDIDFYYFSVLDLHEDGKQMLVRRSAAKQSEMHRLEVWSIAVDGTLKRQNWQPHWDGHGADGEKRVNEMPKVQQPDAEVRWAGFAGGRIVTLCGAGELKVWRQDAAAFQQVGVYPGVAGLPSVTPDGKYVTFVTHERIALLDPAAGKIIGIRRIGLAPKFPVLAWHSDGKKLACGGKGRVIVVDLEANRTTDAMVAELDLKPNELGPYPNFGWAGDECVYHDGMLFDLKSPIAVWRYRTHQHWSSPRGNAVWGVVQAVGENEVALRAFRLPHPAAEAAMLETRQKSELFALRPGDAVRVDVRGLPTGKQAEIKAVLERRVKELGYRLDPKAPIVFQASIDPIGRKVTETYTFSGKKAVTGTYTAKDARLKVIQNGTVLWQNNGCLHPGLLEFFPADVDPKEHISKFGSPNYAIFTDRPLPAVLRAAGVRPQVAGSSTLAAGGVRDK